jgi:predicted Co/Zn/Cd cation transporter (cation efflux family)
MPAVTQMCIFVMSLDERQRLATNAYDNDLCTLLQGAMHLDFAHAAFYTLVSVNYLLNCHKAEAFLPKDTT